MSDFLKSFNKLPAAITILCLGVTACGAKSAEELGEVIPGATALTVCGEARIRNAPKVSDSSVPEIGKVISVVDYGDSPEGTCHTVPASKIRTAESFNNGKWYGISADDLNNGLGGQVVKLKNGKQIVWINEQKATPNK